ncbi:MAG: DUF2298 domain-containing protein, partial [Microgenomates group bacterium]
MNWLTISLQWYLYLFILGIIFLPISTKIFKKFLLDLGYPFAKILSIIFLSYTTYVLATVKIFPFTQTNLLIILSFFIILNLFILYKNKFSQFLNLSISQFLFIFFEELLFLTSFLFWTYIRGQEPSIRSLEKFMDFGFINSILRAKYFPPIDMWYAGGHPINYYYFGHLTGATLIKLANIKPAIGYNLLLSTIFALGVTQVFSLVGNIINLSFLQKPESDQRRFRINFRTTLRIIFYGLIGSFIVNLGGNLHTIYLFTKGYPNENPIPFWKILSGFNPKNYWYPNATRFIPFTIHEFPSYSYVVADLHGHVFDIPFVILTLAILFMFFIHFSYIKAEKINRHSMFDIRYLCNLLISNIQYPISIFLGFLIAIHYMTNAFDSPIYFLLSLIILFFIYRFSLIFLYSLLIIIFSFLIFSLPFSSYFKPFVSGIGVNCGAEIFPYSGKIGPFLFEKGNCQISPFWMLFILWGFFWVSFLIFILINKSKKPISNIQYRISNFILILFSFATFLVFIPEFFYIKDIYPAHFRANTMFKLGYQAFIMMGIASAYVLFIIKYYKKFLFSIFYFLFSIFVFIYPFFS